MTTLYSISNAPVNVSGRSIAARNGHLSKSARAAIAAAIYAGEISLSDLTLHQLAKICGVSPRYAGQARALSQTQRALMASGGLEFSKLPPAKAELERIIGRAGTESSWSVIVEHLDRVNQQI